MKSPIEVNLGLSVFKVYRIAITPPIGSKPMKHIDTNDNDNFEEDIAPSREYKRGRLI